MALSCSGEEGAAGNAMLPSVSTTCSYISGEAYALTAVLFNVTIVTGWVADEFRM